MSELNKRKVRLFVEAVWNEGRLDLIDELVGADYLGRFAWLDEGVVGPEGVRRLVSTSRRQYADLYIKLDDHIAENDLVVARWRASATAPDAHAVTGCTGSCSGISVIRLLAGKQVDSHTAVLNAVATRGFTGQPRRTRGAGARLDESPAPPSTRYPRNHMPE